MDDTSISSAIPEYYAKTRVDIKEILDLENKIEEIVLMLLFLTTNKGISMPYYYFIRPVRYYDTIH